MPARRPSSPTRRSEPSPRMTSGRAGSGPRDRPIAVAITGGIGAGKSTALASFRRHGAATVSSDEIVHHLLRSDPEVKEALLERFGEEILGADGVPDRERIALRVFRDREALDFLEQLLHPRVSREYLAWREQLAALPEPARPELGVRPRQAHEGHVELAVRGIEPEAVVERLALEPALPVRDRRGDRPVRVQAAVDTVGGEDVERVQLRAARVVRAVGGHPRKRHGRRARRGGGDERREDCGAREPAQGRPHSHSIVAGGFDETS